MSVLAPIIFFALFAGVIGFCAWLYLRFRKRNQSMHDPTVGRELAELAGERGWDYTAETTGYLERFSGHPFTRTPGDAPVYDLITGQHRGQRIACFQFSPPKTREAAEYDNMPRYLRVFLIELPSRTPDMVLATDGIGPRMSRRFTLGDEEFDKNIAVNPEDERFAHRVLTEPVKQWLLQNPPFGGASRATIRFTGSELIGWYEQKGRFDARSVEPALDYLVEFLGKVPQDALR